jgi:uncharacterized protein YndB with AHSA1/START domain
MRSHPALLAPASGPSAMPPGRAESGVHPRQQPRASSSLTIEATDQALRGAPESSIARRSDGLQRGTRVCIIRRVALGGSREVITIAMSAVIDAGPLRVWRALTVPAEVAAWDDSILGPAEAFVDYPESCRPVRWRCRLGGVQTVMHERPLDVEPPGRLRSAISIGSMRYEQTFTLAPEPGSAMRTRLGMRVVASNSIPVVGAVVDRFAVRRLATERVDSTLRSLQKWCASGA